jgi:3D-(3,5/4)-trihydroxycyclohexane-1,2-dione acylhydrolase (decyclizing)
VLQQLEHPSEHDVTVNDAFRSVSRFFTRIHRPEQLLSALPEAMRVLLDPVETGAVTIALPEDVQAEAFDWPASFFEPRVWHVRRPEPEPEAVDARRAPPAPPSAR